MNKDQILGIYEVGTGVRKIKISIERIIVWILVFTNIFYLSYFFAKLFKWI